MGLRTELGPDLADQFGGGDLVDPGRSTSCSAWVEKGATASSIRASRTAIWALMRSMLSSIIRSITAVLGGEATQCFLQLGGLQFCAPPRQLRQRSRVTAPGHQGFHHLAPGHPVHVRQHCRELDLGVLEQLLRPLHLQTTITDNSGSPTTARRYRVRSRNRRSPVGVPATARTCRGSPASAAPVLTGAAPARRRPARPCTRSRV